MTLREKLEKIHNEWLNGEEVTESDIELYQECLNNNLLEESAMHEYLARA